ncbi:MAG: extracellular solute-binding protein, partial [Propionibacterium sp.]|nr:extracellular solute-binding protein [Propionibacterium sp.]
MTRQRTGLKLAAALTGVVLLLAGCGGTADNGDTDDGATGGTGGAGTDGGVEAQTITWWHNSNSSPGKEYYESVAADFEAMHEGLTIEIEAMQHEDMVTKLEAAWQSGDTPDIYMERGGGELADKVEVGLVKDLTDLAADEIGTIGGSVAGWQVDGRTYALPFSMGVVGFWYNKDIFADAGIEAPPTTMEEFYAVVDQLKDAGIDPISVGAGDKWPAAHYWYYFGLRQCSEQVLSDAVTSLDFQDPCFIRAGEDLEELVAAEPFNPGFLTTVAQAGPTSASGLLATGRVAMELAGHWEPGVMQGLTEDNLGLGEATGWFAFPTVPRGEGDPTATLGGGDAWAVPESSPEIAVEFTKYLLSDEVQTGFAEQDMGLPTNPGANSAVSDPALADLLQVRDDAA